MRSTFKQLYYINRAKVKADGTTALLCRITIDGKNSVITTGVYCKPEDFNAKKGEVKDGKANGTLLKFRERIGQAYGQRNWNGWKNAPLKSNPAPLTANPSFFKNV